MRQTEYFIRKDFWTGYYKLTPRVRTSAGQGIVTFLILLGIVISIAALIILSLPFWLLMFGLSVNRHFRFQIGIFSILALLYFYLDIHNHWFSSFLFLGRIDSEGELLNGIFGFQGLKYFHILNLTSAIIAIGFIVDSIFYRKSENQNHWIIYLIFGFVGFLISTNLTEVYFQNSEDYLVQKKEIVTLESETIPIVENATNKENALQYINQDSISYKEKEVITIDKESDSINYTTNIINYFNDVSTKENFDANKYFADEVYRYITLRNVTPLDINYNFSIDSKEYTNQKFMFDETSIIFKDEIDGIKYYSFWLTFECFRTSKQQNQRSEMKVLYGLNEYGKLYYLKYSKVESTIFY